VSVTDTRCPRCEGDYQSTRDESVRASGHRSYGWKTLARETLQRDETCTRCWHRASKYAVHLDGIAPRNEGGLDPERVVAMCQDCRNAHGRELWRRGR
jgi:hypothetical protein